MSRKVILANSESTKRKDKIPDYAKDFRNEWLYIRGINKKCGEFITRLNFGRYLFNSPPANNLMKYIRKILRAEELGKIKDISGLIFKNFDASNIECLEEQLDNYPDLIVDKDSLEIDQEFYDFIIKILYPGFKDFFELINLTNDKVKKEEPTFNFDF